MWPLLLIELLMRCNMFYSQILITAYYFQLASSPCPAKSVCFCSYLEGDWAWHLVFATRDVHLFNSIIGVYQLSPSAWVEANPQWSCAWGWSEPISASLSPGHMGLLLRLEAPGRLLHYCLLTLVCMKVYGLPISVCVAPAPLPNPASHMSGLDLLSIFHGGPSTRIVLMLPQRMKPWRQWCCQSLVRLQFTAHCLDFAFTVVQVSLTYSAVYLQTTNLLLILSSSSW